jgi:RNA polymerase sigma factor (sigma-70 family)
MSLPAKCYDLDMVPLADEELVVLAEECGYVPAATVLLARYHDWVGELAARRAWHSRLQGADVDDARQNAFLSLAEAISRYDTSQMGRRRGCRFRSFLYRVVQARYCDFARHVGRLHKRWQNTEVLPDVASNGRPGASEPADMAGREELLAQVEQRLQCLGQDDRRLWERLASGASLRTVARDLGLSYDAAKRARRRVLQALSAIN